ncbi:hypothetical protein [Streptomyces sp. NBC_01320]|uniref:hypothetical protein n=1 Tax=Streptomyces sp. NBC_01320 TaxID=2903824 RepID=UPI003FA35E5F
MEFERAGDIVTLKEILEDGERALVIGHTDEERVVRLAEPLPATGPGSPARRASGSSSSAPSSPVPAASESARSGI